MCNFSKTRAILISTRKGSSINDKKKRTTLTHAWANFLRAASKANNLRTEHPALRKNRRLTSRKKKRFLIGMIINFKRSSNPRNRCTDLTDESINKTHHQCLHSTVPPPPLLLRQLLPSLKRPRASKNNASNRGYFYVFFFCDNSETEVQQFREQN